MGKISNTLEGPLPKGENSRQWVMLKKLYERLAFVINGMLSFGNGTSLDNMAGNWFNGTIATAGVDFTINHGLGRVPSGFLVFEKNQACDVYLGSVAPTSTTITLRTSVNATTVRIFIC